MQFTAGEVLRAAMANAPPLKRHPDLEKDFVAAFNERIREAVLECSQHDPERLMTTTTIPNSVASVDPVDLTDDGNGSGTLEWLVIGYVDALDSDGEVIDEVWTGTIEARNRLKNEYQVLESPIGMLRENLQKMEQVSGWSDVDTLTVSGILAPSQTTAAAIDTTTFEYPLAVRAFLVWDMVMILAPSVPDLPGQLLSVWEGRRMEAYNRMVQDSIGAVLSRIEEIPSQYEI